MALHLRPLPDETAVPESMAKAAELAERVLRERADAKMTGCLSYVQRKLSWGYNYTANVFEHMETCGTISPPDQHGQRRWLKVAAR